jgi:RNA methyltransferase, TrmH family
MDQPPLTSAANPRLRAVARLRNRRDREATGLTIVDGVREVSRALAAGVEVVEAYAGADLADGTDGSALLAALGRSGVDVRRVAGPALDRISFGDRNEGIVAVVRQPATDLERLALPENPLVVIVESVEKPGNLGAILRSADGAAADALVAADPQTDLFNPNAIRASLGTIFSVPLGSASASEVLAWLLAAGIRPVAARVDAAQTYVEADLRGPLAIVLGSEAEGLTRAWDDSRVVPVRIPMLGTADSLNVSVAAAVLLYEARRQRGWRKA